MVGYRGGAIGAPCCPLCRAFPCRLLSVFAIQDKNDAISSIYQILFKLYKIIQKIVYMFVQITPCLPALCMVYYRCNQERHLIATDTNKPKAP